MKRTYLFLLCLILMVLTACQPTPEEGGEATTPGRLPVVQGDDLSDTPSSYEMQDTLADGIGLDVKAEVVLPKTPLCTAKVKRYSFDIPLIEKVAGVLFGDAPIYQYAETKQELIQYSVTCKMQLEMVQDQLSEFAIADAESVIADVEKAIPSRLDAEKPASLKNILSDYDGYIEVDNGREKKASLIVHSNKRRQVIIFNDSGFKKHLLEEVEPLTITPEGATEQAMDVLSRLGLAEEFDAVKVEKLPICHTIVDARLNEVGYDFPKGKHEGQNIILMRKIGGAKQVYSDQVQSGATDGEYDANVFWEIIRIEFDNDGMTFFDWQEPGDIEVVQNDVAVIGLDAAYQAFRDYLGTSQNKYTYEPFRNYLSDMQSRYANIPSELNPENITITVNRIELGMTCVIGKNDTIEAIPVWEFFGEIEYRTDSGEVFYVDVAHTELTQEASDFNSVCTINALTGKRIDRGLGY